jgi:hypothetical protein
MIALLLALACAELSADPRDAWDEVPPPRPDLQCWVRWGNSASLVCAPSLTSTRGASL